MPFAKTPPVAPSIVYWTGFTIFDLLILKIPL